MAKKLNQIEVIEIIRQVHGDRYDYSKMKYTTSKSKLELICKIHGSFLSSFDQLKRGQGCPICGKSGAAKQRRISFEDFEWKANEIHLSKYKYDRESYAKISAKVRIQCPEHG